MNIGIRKFYSRIFGSYERINTILTLGMDALWRKRAVREAVACAKEKERFLDICCGTGQTAMNLRRKLPDSARVFGADFSHEMLSMASETTARKRLKHLHFSMADALHLPFKDNCLDIITISFATRNLDEQKGHLLKAYQEFHRVLKPVGCFINLETSQPPNKIIKTLYHLYIKLTVAPIGRLLSGSKESYAYLSSSMQSFHSAPELATILHQAGFAEVKYHRLLLGGVAIHKAFKA